MLAGRRPGIFKAVEILVQERDEFGFFEDDQGVGVGKKRPLEEPVHIWLAW